MRILSGRTAAIAAVLAFPAGFSALALATPPSGQSPEILALTRLDDPARVNTDRIKFQTKGPVDVSNYKVTYAPNGFSGWHTHPGVLLVLVKSGTVLRQVGCEAPRAYGPGESFVESDEQPAGTVRNPSGTDDAVLYVAQVVPSDAPRRDDAADPGC
jgi:quercetin dioxygenase-like cupin family protein